MVMEDTCKLHLGRLYKIKEVCLYMSHSKNSNQDAATANGLEYKIIRKKFYNHRACDSEGVSFDGGGEGRWRPDFPSWCDVSLS